MSTLHKLIEGLPIKVISRDEVEIDGQLFNRQYVETFVPGGDTATLLWRGAPTLC